MSRFWSIAVLAALLSLVGASPAGAADCIPGWPVCL